MTETIVLDLDKLHESIPTMAKSLADYMYDAAVFCFHHHSHSSGKRCEVRSLVETLETITVVWSRQITDRIVKTFGDTDYAVEYAAEGIAILTIFAMTDYTVIERSRRSTGIDFWLGTKGDTTEAIIQHKARMEVKGRTQMDSDSQIRSAVRKGLNQTRLSKSTGFPACVILTEFSRPVIYMVWS